MNKFDLEKMFRETEKTIPIKKMTRVSYIQIGNTCVLYITTPLDDYDVKQTVDLLQGKGKTLAVYTPNKAVKNKKGLSVGDYIKSLEPLGVKWLALKDIKELMKQEEQKKAEQ